jgi:hypothetical protein
MNKISPTLRGSNRAPRPAVTVVALAPAGSMNEASLRCGSSTDLIRSGQPRPETGLACRACSRHARSRPGRTTGPPGNEAGQAAGRGESPCCRAHLICGDWSRPRSASRLEGCGSEVAAGVLPQSTVSSMMPIIFPAGMASTTMAIHAHSSPQACVMIDIPLVTEAAVTTATSTQDAGLHGDSPPRGRAGLQAVPRAADPARRRSPDLAAAAGITPPYLRALGWGEGVGQEDHTEQHGETQDRDDRRQP